jgi:hypothetical protein
MEPNQDRPNDQQYPQPVYPQAVEPQQQPQQQPAQAQQPIYSQPQSTPQPIPSIAQPDGLHPMVVMQPGEKIICTVKRHPFGILSMYFAGLVGMAFAAVLAVVLLPNLLEQYNVENINLILYLGLAIVAFFVLLVLGIATSVYWQNQWIVTSDSITQISQVSLFSRQVSQVSMEHLEDVTVDQSGVLPHLFNYGILKVESAGEKSKFQFPYCPSPNTYARQILEAHELFLEERRNIKQITQIQR